MRGGKCLPKSCNEWVWNDICGEGRAVWWCYDNIFYEILYNTKIIEISSRRTKRQLLCFPLEGADSDGSDGIALDLKDVFGETF